MDKRHVLVSAPSLKPFTALCRLVTSLAKKPFENVVGKGENAGTQHFFLFPQRFLCYSRLTAPIQSHFNCRLLILSVWTGLKFCCLGRG